MVDEELQEALESCPTSQPSWRDIFAHVERVANLEKQKKRPGEYYNKNHRTLRFKVAEGMYQVLKTYPQAKEFFAEMAMRKKMIEEERKRERELEAQREAERERIRQEIRNKFEGGAE